MAQRKKRKRSTGRAKPSTPRTADPAAPAPPQAPASSRRARLDEAPKAPWYPFPLVELTILGGIVLLILGVTGVANDRVAFVVCGLALVTVASLELSLREHFAGYRSHSSLLAGAAVVITLIPLGFFTHLQHTVLIGIGVAVFAVCFLALRRAFQRRTGGLGFRL
jgi:hypothetical protein